MTQPGPASYKVVKHVDKIEALKSFIEAAASRLEIPSDLARTAPTLLARSPESPVAQAILAAPAGLYRFGAPRIIFTRLCDASAMPALPDVMARAAERQFRLLADARYLDAHEQLVLATDCCWIGDCMRRDPMKRDAFEKFSESCANTARFATVSFEHLWNAARPIGADALSRAVPGWSKPTDGADSLAATAVAGEAVGERPEGLASTRH